MACQGCRERAGHVRQGVSLAANARPAQALRAFARGVIPTKTEREAISRFAADKAKTLSGRK